jgi:hypothetical protein
MLYILMLLDFDHFRGGRLSDQGLIFRSNPVSHNSFVRPLAQHNLDLVRWSAAGKGSTSLVLAEPLSVAVGLRSDLRSGELGVG